MVFQDCAITHVKRTKTIRETQPLMQLHKVLDPYVYVYLADLGSTKRKRKRKSNALNVEMGLPAFAEMTPGNASCFYF